MSEPPPQENLPDELIDAYRRASASDRSRPGERIRESILARSKQPAASRHTAAERPFASAPPAANESHWKWKAAASLAAVGLAGLLAVQTWVTAPHKAPPAHPDFTAEDVTTDQTTADKASDGAEVVPAPPAAANPVSREQHRPRVGHEADAASGVAPAAPVAAVAPSVSQEEVAGRSMSEVQASRTGAPAARLSSPMDTMAARAASPALSSRRDQVVAALHATFPDLFTGPAAAGTVRVALVLNGDGTVYKIAREDFATAGAADASVQLQHALGIGPDELEAAAHIMAFGRTADQPNTIVVALGVRSSTPGPAGDAH